MKKCTGCGECCKAEVCEVGHQIYNTSTPPCPGLLFEKDRHWCELVKIVPNELRAFLKLKMGIGFGCDSF